MKTHPSGRAPGIVRGRGSPHAGSLRQMQAPGEPEAPALFKPGWGGGSRHRVKSSVGQPRRAGTQPGPPVGLPAWPGARLSPCCVSKFLPPPPIPPPSFTWPPCQPSAVPNFHAAPKVGSWLRCGGHGCFLGGFRSQRGLGLSLPTVATLWGEEAWPNEPLLTYYFLYFLWYTLPWWAEGMRSAVGSVHVMIGSDLFSSSGPWDTSRDKVSPGHAPSPLRQKYPPGS